MAGRHVDSLTSREILNLLMPAHDWANHSMVSVESTQVGLRVLCSCGTVNVFSREDVTKTTACDYPRIRARLRQLARLDRRAA